jgi:hypothetical protein
LLKAECAFLEKVEPLREMSLMMFAAEGSLLVNSVLLG